MPQRRKAIMSVLTAAMMSLALGTGQARADTSPDAAAFADADQTPAEIQAYWTPERLRTAEEEATATPEPDDEGTPTTTPASTMSDSGTGSAPPSARTRDADALTPFSASKVWSAHGTQPAATIGKLYYTNNAGGRYYCSATVINSDNHSTIWTAGHCVTDGHKHWYSKFLFAPDYHDGQWPYGTWAWTKVAAPHGYHDGKSRSFDMAAIALAPNSAGRRVGDVVGWQGYKFGKAYDQTDWSDVRSFGFPVNTHPSRSGISGADLRFCVDSKTYRESLFQVVDCDMGSGSSGGPWLDDLDLSRGWGYLIGHNSHHTDAGFATERSPWLDNAAINVRDTVRRA
ncbi:hypothetical protein GCM10023196_027680 [Actinoallomurus vinaceus]|uniref:Peptidase n=1 Tax=Actinoallomurus vinaceus TaxID=1080074 RepID=A0ABP8U6H3_9ACTN